MNLYIYRREYKMDPVDLEDFYAGIEALKVIWKAETKH